ncbi:MAG: hypothetical protein WCX17_02285 [Parcubacteria group bacterium]|jgi:hypothetical protein
MKANKKCGLALTVAFIVLFCMTGGAYAADFDGVLSTSIKNLPGNADVAGMGGADVGAPVDFTSPDPSTLGAGEETAFGFSGTCGYITGMNGRFCGGSVAARLPLGTLQVSYSGGNSDSVFLPKEGVDFKINRSNSATIQYGVKVAEKVFGSEDKVYAGVGVTPFSETRTTILMGGTKLLKTDSSEYAFSFGTHYENKNFNAGAFYEYSHSSDTTKDLIADEKVNEKSESHLFRTGASYKIVEGLMVIANYQYANVGGYVTNRIFGGAEVCPIESVCGYAGHNGSGFTGGIGIYPSDSWGMNLAYVDNLDKKLEAQIGKKPSVIMFSLYYLFQDKKGK